MEKTPENLSPLTYGEYLALDTLLSLQKPKTSAHDETLFITIHQVYELWFAQLLREGALLNSFLQSGEEYGVVDSLRRILKIMKTLVGQTDIIETIRSQSFRGFRDALDRSSGLQSYQFILIQLWMGWRNTKLYQLFDATQQERFEAQLQQPSLWDSFCTYLRGKGLVFENSVRLDGAEAAYAENPALREALYALTQRDRMVDIVIGHMLDLDEGLQEWRYRHIKMVERTIGDQVGTGGSSGVSYLKRTLYKQAFPDLWQLSSYS